MPDTDESDNKSNQRTPRPYFLSQSCEGHGVLIEKKGLMHPTALNYTAFSVESLIEIYDPDV